MKMRGKNVLIFLFILFGLFTCSKKEEAPSSKKEIPLTSAAESDYLDIHFTPEKPDVKGGVFYSDMGAWYGFSLPDEKKEEFCGGFTGPYLFDKKQWVSPQLARFVLFDAFTDKLVKLKLIEQHNFPGYIEQRLEIDSLFITLDLWFLTSRTAFLRAEMRNGSKFLRAVIPGLQGEIFSDMGKVEVGEERIEVKLNGGGKFIIKPMEGSIYTTDYAVDKNSYFIKKRRMNFFPGMRLFNFFIISYVENEREWLKEKAFNRVPMHQPEKMFQLRRKQWRHYAQKCFPIRTKWADDSLNRNIAMKALITLMNNWKAPLGDLKHGGIVPSSAVKYFDGFWAWDSWKHAFALAHIDDNLAKEQIRAMFDFQNEKGMIPDCVFPDESRNNWRDTKPPLAAWAVNEIFETTKDTTFLREIFPRLVRYHRWWYKYRDHDGNGLCEYGCTDGSKVAALWESGMDNAVRFDSARVVLNKSGEWSLSQESVDLNSYLYAEKLYLARMAKVLSVTDEADKLKQEAEVLKKKIQTMMFDEKTGYFYDIQLDDKKIVPVQGPEGWIPLWAKVATQEQAERVKNVIADTAKFNTFVPFPTVARDDKNFSLDYWRGPVWLDQAYFAIKGLKNYGYYELADELTQKILNNIQGLKNSTTPIFENYNPLTGEGLNAPNFSWSAAHLLMLLNEW